DEGRFAAREVGEGDGAGSGSVSRRDRRERGALHRARVRELPCAERRIRDERDRVPLAERREEMLGVALVEVVEHLVARDRARADDRDRILEIRGVEVADAPRADLPLLLQLFERAEGLLERTRPAPVEHVEVEVIGAEPAEALLAGEEGA